MYYYIFENQRIVTGAYSNFQELQPELYEFLGDENSKKVKFYLANKDNEKALTIQEIRNCKLNEIIFDLAVYKIEKISEVENISNAKKEELFPADKRDEVWAGIESGDYTVANLKTLITTLTTEKNSIISQINTALTKEEIDTIVSSNTFNDITL